MSYLLKMALYWLIFIAVCVVIVVFALFMLGVGLEMVRCKRKEPVIPWPKLPRID